MDKRPGLGGADLPIEQPTKFELVVKDRERTRYDDFAGAAVAGRRGDRIIWLMSAFGTKRTCPPRQSMSGFGGKADMT
jgi:hypothetical protein